MLKLVDFLQDVGPLEEKLTDDKILREYKKSIYSKKSRQNKTSDDDFMFDETKSAQERMDRMNEY